MHKTHTRLRMFQRFKQKIHRDLKKKNCRIQFFTLGRERGEGGGGSGVKYSS